MYTSRGHAVVPGEIQRSVVSTECVPWEFGSALATCGEVQRLRNMSRTDTRENVLPWRPSYSKHQTSKKTTQQVNTH